MSAKEMFEKLGYECYECESTIQYLANYEIVSKSKEITFLLLSHSFYAQHYFNPLNVTVDEFKAIQQQLKELGWLEEETCTNKSEFDSIDEFECSNCGIVLSEYQQIEIDEDDGKRFFCDYRPKYCPNCGRKIIEENEDE